METKMKEFRAKKDLTQEELAKKVDVSRQTILYIEQGGYNPSLLLAMKICKIFNCKVEDLFIPNKGDLK